MKIYTVVGMVEYGSDIIIKSYLTEGEAKAFIGLCEAHDEARPKPKVGTRIVSEVIAWKNAHPALDSMYDGYAVIEHELMGGDV